MAALAAPLTAEVTAFAAPATASRTGRLRVLTEAGADAVAGEAAAVLSDAAFDGLAGAVAAGVLSVGVADAVASVAV